MVHLLLVTFPAQGHLNPALQFAKRLVRAGPRVTFATAISAHRRMVKPPSLPGLSYATFSDGYDDGFSHQDDPAHYMAQIKQVGSRTLADLVQSLARDDRHVTCIIYNFLLPWAADVAGDLAIPSVVLWVQPASLFAIYSHYFNGYDSIINTLNKDPSSTIELPGLPLLTPKDLPSFLLPSNTYPFVLAVLGELIGSLDTKARPETRVLVNTFDALEPDALTAVDSLKLIGIGPLVPSAFLDTTDESDTTYGGDLVNNEKDYAEWLGSKPKRSVVYVSFGSLSTLPKRQMEEIYKGLVEIGRPFLWVIRQDDKGTKTDTKSDTIDAKTDMDTDNTDTETESGFWKDESEMGGEGLIVPWCSQVEVLSHPSTGCFVTHCGWNSTSESLAMGVPMVCFPQWSDQTTNAKLVEDVWKIGVRVKVNEDGVLEGGELKRCLEEVMGGEEVRKNAEKWRVLAREAAGEGGSSDKNIRAFVKEIGGECSAGGVEIL
ncbi:hypothetical protein AAC387_Pa08g2571 [Persea americana]